MSDILAVYRKTSGEEEVIEVKPISGIEFVSTDFQVNLGQENIPPSSGQYAIVSHSTKTFTIWVLGDGVYRITLE